MFLCVVMIGLLLSSLNSFAIGLYELSLGSRDSHNYNNKDLGKDDQMALVDVELSAFKKQKIHVLFRIFTHHANECLFEDLVNAINSIPNLNSLKIFEKTMMIYLEDILAEHRKDLAQKNLCHQLRRMAKNNSFNI